MQVGSERRGGVGETGRGWGGSFELVPSRPPPPAVATHGDGAAVGGEVRCVEVRRGGDRGRCSERRGCVDRGLGAVLR